MIPGSRLVSSPPEGITPQVGVVGAGVLLGVGHRIDPTMKTRATSVTALRCILTWLASLVAQSFAWHVATRIRDQTRKSTP